MRGGGTTSERALKKFFDGCPSGLAASRHHVVLRLTLLRFKCTDRNAISLTSPPNKSQTNLYNFGAHPYPLIVSRLRLRLQSSYEASRASLVFHHFRTLVESFAVRHAACVQCV